MAVTYTAVPMGNSSNSYRSVVRNVLVSVAAGQSEAITIIHWLGGAAGTGVCPTEIRTALRSVVSAPSGWILGADHIISSLNQSQAVINFTKGTQSTLLSGYIDIICEFTHSLVS